MIIYLLPTWLNIKNQDEPKIVIANWMRGRNTIEFIGLWEMLNNSNFNSIEFDTFKRESGSNSFTLTPQKWIKSTNAIGIISKSGKYGGGTYAHKDIAFEFASWLSPEFKLYIIKDYQRLKESESHQGALEWDVKRFISKANYKIHTDAVKENLISSKLSAKEQGFVYASEADLLNYAVFNMSASQWRRENPNEKGNIRDAATIEQLVVIANLENVNALLIEQKLPPEERVDILKKMAMSQLEKLAGSKSIGDLKQLSNQISIIIPENTDSE
jgi:KilA-N domain.